MEVQILKLIYDYSINRKPVDKNYVETLIDIVVNSKALNKYVCNYQILNVKDSADENGILLAAYHPISKRIDINADGINQMLECSDKYQVLFNPVEQFFYKNLLISQCILHELEHANQRRIVDNEKSLESAILKLSMAQINFDTCIKLPEKGYSKKEIMTYILSKKAIRTQNYKSNYLFAPEERLAEIKSYREILASLSHIKKYVPNLIEFGQTNEIENLLSGFEYSSGFISSPTTFYLQQNGNKQALNRFNWYDENPSKCLEKSKKNYSLGDRLKYGLMIDTKEFENCTNALYSSKKYNC